MDERQTTILNTTNDSQIIKRYHLINPQPEIIENLQSLEKFTGRNEWLQTLPNTSAARNELQYLQNEPTGKVDAYKKQLEERVMDIRVSLRRQIEHKLQKDPSFTTSGTPIGYEERIINTLKSLGVEVKVTSMKDIWDLQGYFDIIDGKPVLSFCGLANLAHEVEHFLEWLELDKKTVNRKSTLGELREAYAEMASMYCYREHGCAPGVTPVVENTNITGKEFMEAKIGIGDDQFDATGLLSTNNYPLF
ncbi:hypothetical protein A2313_01715 [Candidatus Roizmanbacteria bacterium RIFOXYB2_FULL_41_10]|uniref:Uncharacterized protein n=1 Tax=Candidatus Roizmanbacteria bacterium RIFOXYA1_FULL_41_12 TaxID=1802082 RepID=A0A1F7KGN5_9BACT|nr:MAG: hypothetical protein A2262_01855 [Candidatus Roizmanbacteria bacterium RIFOXYA2_FULL_41_8]OGK67026.1 MAG: hypothetical protein A2209_03155 [Candidatus Roizmanbacteria bacterium RIFOXYA1_FULL_41_12]OGK67588.1 MAG: hypothetical protein A2377_00010 [Candidatus Roizmanbacteria bacterium RIFOXYB1_FULL_41_27]OGK71084.1 MAG: hypothetical protein A2313_01715 [Candidatus Roizmanbacteria bacterium RIFOXYB2_FULL_41_10]OGK71680.1 MAG: hypothetical protein A2403_04440 [Candidatus Roizmanbacteria bac